MMLLYNSLVKNKVEFVPIEDGKVKLYTCGPTVYDYSHVGNFRTFLFEDLLKRVLIAFGFKVKHVMNQQFLQWKLNNFAHDQHVK